MSASASSERTISAGAAATRTSIEAPNESPIVDWSLLSPQGRLLVYVALCPNCTISEIMTALDMTERGVRFLLKDLLNQDMLVIESRGRRHHYRVNLEAPLLHPTIKGLTLRPLLGRLVKQAEEKDREECVRG